MMNPVFARIGKKVTVLGALVATGAAATSVAAPLRDRVLRPLEVFFVDVEGGAATLMITPTGESILVDSGWPREDGRDAKRIEHAARYVAGLKAIDHYVTTHWHTDHYGGIEQLAKLIPVRKYWDRGIPPQAEDGAKDFPILMAAYKRASAGESSPLRPGNTIPLQGTGLPLELKVLTANGKVVGEGAQELPHTCDRHPALPANDTSDNRRSISLLLKYGRFEFLNCGDLTWDVEHKLVCPKNRVGKVDLWQVTHHGLGPQSNNPALIEATEPACAVMANGPRKGGSASVVQTLKKSPSIQGIYQLHRNVTTKLEDNAPEQRIANLDEKCHGEFIRVRLLPEGDRYTVYKGSQALDTFKVR